MAVAIATSLPLLLLTGWQPAPVPLGIMVAPSAGDELTGHSPAAPPFDTPLGTAPDEPTVPAEAGAPPPEFLSWALIDPHTGAIVGSDTLTATSTTASMIKVWLVADHLRLTAEAGEEPTPERLAELELIVRDSDNENTHALFRELGEEASIERLISICGLTDSSAVPGSWSNTRISARDTARLGACLADGRALGGDQRWTAWLLGTMRAVRGLGDFGIRHALPAGDRSSVAIKNGWVIRGDEGAWHVSCLAIGDGWTMGVLARYPTELGFEHGADLCRSVAEQHLLPRLS